MLLKIVCRWTLYDYGCGLLGLYLDLTLPGSRCIVCTPYAWNRSEEYQKYYLEYIIIAFGR